MPVWMENFVSNPRSMIGSKHLHYDFLRSGSGVGVGVKHQVLLIRWLKHQVFFFGGG